MLASTSRSAGGESHRASVVRRVFEIDPFAKHRTTITEEWVSKFKEIFAKLATVEQGDRAAGLSPTTSAKVSHGTQLHSLWTHPAAAVS